MKLVEGRVAIVTGAGRGLGRAHALMLAKHGAKIVVNDLGASASGVGTDASPAQDVVDEIKAMGGEAVVNGGNAASFTDAKGMVEQAMDTFGNLDIVINNAGILRDRMMVNMTEDEWDSVINVHLKSTFAMSHHAANIWRSQSKAGNQPDARIINTSSHSGLYCNIGQANYAAAKAGIASFSVVIARELSRYGVTVNALCPRATTRMTEGLRDWDDEALEKRKPDWTAALATYLASPGAKDISGRVFETWGYGFTVAESWQHGATAVPSMDPNEIGDNLKVAIADSKKNAGINLGEWLDP